MIIIKDQIELLIKAVKDKYGEFLNIGYEYNSIDDEHFIWHTNKKFEFEDSSFAEYVGEKYYNYIISKGIFNCTFGYDVDKAELNIAKIDECLNNEYCSKTKAYSTHNSKFKKQNLHFVTLFNNDKWGLAA